MQSAPDSQGLRFYEAVSQGSQKDGWSWKRPVWRKLWRSFGPTVLLKQGHPELIAQEQEYVEIAFKYLQGQGLHNLSGQSLQITAVPSHP